MKVYGLIGYPLTHSFSQRYFTEKFQKEGIPDTLYRNFALSSLQEFPELIQQERPLGLNVTIPYKEGVIPFLDELSPVVRETGACNCIALREGRLIGYNTDVIGFEQSLLTGLKPQHHSALILGTGGAAKAVAWVLQKLGIDFSYVSRTGGRSQVLSYTDLDAKIIQNHPLIINTTPVGMFPRVEETVPIDFTAIGSNHFLFDLIYNPETTRFLQLGADHGATIRNGYEMLLIQAEESWKIWNNLS